MSGLAVQAPSNPERSLWHLPCRITQPKIRLTEARNIGVEWINKGSFDKDKKLQNATNQGMSTRKSNNVLVTETHVAKHIPQMVRTWTRGMSIIEIWINLEFHFNFLQGQQNEISAGHRRHSKNVKSARTDYNVHINNWLSIG